MRVSPVSTSEWLFSELDKSIKKTIDSSKIRNKRISKIKNFFNL